jgi:hypothetical protein
MSHHATLAVTFNRDGSVSVRNRASGRETRIVGDTALRVRWAALHETELEAYACPRCGSTLGALRWEDRTTEPTCYVCPDGHVSLAAGHHSPRGERLN